MENNIGYIDLYDKCFSYCIVRTNKEKRSYFKIIKYYLFNYNAKASDN